MSAHFVYDQIIIFPDRGLLKLRNGPSDPRQTFMTYIPTYIKYHKNKAYTEYSPPSPAFFSPFLHIQSGLRYKVVEIWECTEWPQIDLEYLTVKSALYITTVQNLIAFRTTIRNPPKKYAYFYRDRGSLPKLFNELWNSNFGFLPFSFVCPYKINRSTSTITLIIYLIFHLYHMLRMYMILRLFYIKKSPFRHKIAPNVFLFHACRAYGNGRGPG